MEEVGAGDIQITVDKVGDKLVPRLKGFSFRWSALTFEQLDGLIKAIEHAMQKIASDA